MKAKKRLLFFIVFFLALPLYALDDAEFWNLGFSRDARYVSFGQYWVDSSTLIAHSELRIVDVAKNSFAPNGSNSFQSTQRVATGSNGRNALLEAVRAAHSTLTRYEIKHVNQGRIIYLRINGAEPTDTINFKDFQSGNEYSVRMVQQANSSGASFHIRGTITFADGRQRSFTVGLPDYYRPNVSHYTLSQIILSPNNRGHIFVIQQSQQRGRNAPVARYMIETLSLDT